MDDKDKRIKELEEVAMDFESKYIDELIEYRKDARANKNYKLSDEIRNYLDTKLVFVFDAKWGQEVYYLTESYFKNQGRKIETMAMSKRQYVEYRIKQDINAEKKFEAWLYSTRKSIGLV
mgnify:CR=1 FL=1